MKIVIAPDSFKGTNSSAKVASLIEKGVRKVFPKAVCRKIPVGDGGEGTLDALVESMGGTMFSAKVNGPLGNPVVARYGMCGTIAMIEMAEASGITRTDGRRLNPLEATTRGVGELLKEALERGANKIIVGVGGSATNDGGVGMARALGYSFRDAQGEELPEGGGALDALVTIDGKGVNPRLFEAEVIVASDVTNPLTGEQGASRVYGPQKGATPQMVERLETNLTHLARCVADQLGIQKSDVPGSGAAGGLGFGLLVFCQAVIQSGIETVLDTVGIDQELQNADLLITGEGRVDGQSLFGKVPFGLAQRAKKHGIPLLLIAGGIESGASKLYHHGVDGMISTVERPVSLSEALLESAAALEIGAEKALRLIQIGMKLASDRKEP